MDECGQGYPFMLNGHAVTCTLPMGHDGNHMDEESEHPATLEWEQ